MQPPTDGDDESLRSRLGDPPTFRPNQLTRDLVERVRRQGDDRPERLYVTTAKGRLLGTVDTTALLARARADELPGPGSTVVPT